MPPFVIRRSIAAPVSQVWVVVTDFAGYGRWIPATGMTHDPGEPGPGWRFTGHTGLGPLRFADPMVIERWSPPDTSRGRRDGEFQVRKTGRVLDGWARVRLEPGPVAGGADGCLLTWTEEIRLRPRWLGRATSPLTDPLNRWLFAGAVAAMAGHAEQVAE